MATKANTKVAIRLDRTDMKRIAALFEGVSTRLVNFAPLYEDIIDYVLVPSAAKTFDAEGRPDAWAPLSPSYALRKAKAIGYTQILFWDGDLHDSLATKDGNKYSVRLAGQNRLQFGTTRPWAAVHQDGDATHPARPFVVIQDDDYDTILDMSADYLMGRGLYKDE